MSVFTILLWHFYNLLSSFLFSVIDCILAPVLNFLNRRLKSKPIYSKRHKLTYKKVTQITLHYFSSTGNLRTIFLLIYCVSLELQKNNFFTKVFSKIFNYLLKLHFGSVVVFNFYFSKH